MRPLLTSFVILLTLLTLGPISGDLQAYDQVLIFSDDFSAGSVENWIQLLGEWTAESYEFCMLECGT
jgi:hypothetical protein